MYLSPQSRFYVRVIPSHMHHALRMAWIRCWPPTSKAWMGFLRWITRSGNSCSPQCLTDQGFASNFRILYFEYRKYNPSLTPSESKKPTWSSGSYQTEGIITFRIESGQQHSNLINVACVTTQTENGSTTPRIISHSELSEYSVIISLLSPSKREELCYLGMVPLLWYLDCD